MKVSDSMDRPMKLSRRGLKQAARAVRHAAGSATTATFKPQDVWDWTAGKYRTRSVVLLSINILLFAGLACFTYWLRTGEIIPFLSEQYTNDLVRAMNPRQENQATLVDFLTATIPVQDVPMMLPIVGLLLATLTAIPILVSMLYRFPVSLLFAGIIGLVAVMPSLAMFVTVSCYLVRLKALRFSFRYATALIGLLPCVVYYVIATRNPAEPVAPLPPVEAARLYVPWVIALIGACIEMGVVLLIARLVNYRPGAIAPLLAVMFVIPVVLFETQVGRDELYYRLLEKKYGPGSHTHFVDKLDVRSTVERIAAARFQELQQEGSSLTEDSVRELVQLNLTMTFEVFEDEKAEAIRACRRFREMFPASRYVPNALYLEGRAWDLRVDRELFRRELIVRYYEDFSDPRSEEIWQKLHDDYPQSPLAAEATYRLAKLEARRGDVDQAVALLDELIARYDTRQPGAGAASHSGSIWAKRPPSENLDVRPSAVVLRARRLRELLVKNRDPHQNDLALVDLLNCDPHHPMYAYNLRRMLDQIPSRYPMTRLEDNLRVLLAVEQAGRSRSSKIRALNELIEELKAMPESDALGQALYELGRAYEEDSLPEKASATYELLVRERPDSAWAESARSRLAAMGVSTN